MLSLPPSVRVFVATQPIDGRKGADSLMAIVRDLLGHDPLSGHLYVFLSRPCDRVRVVYWDLGGASAPRPKQPPGREKKSRKGRHPGRAALPRIEVNNPVPPELRVCPRCGAEMTTVGHARCEILSVI
jgi:transposase